jgi:hypothetical protein
LRNVSLWSSGNHGETLATTRGQAWTLAGQIKSLADNLEQQQWELAIALPAAWFLHDRP